MCVCVWKEWKFLARTFNSRVKPFHQVLFPGRPPGDPRVKRVNSGVNPFVAFRSVWLTLELILFTLGPPGASPGKPPGEKASYAY